jgi:exodeoxyribonuclease VII small subunit
MDDVKNLSFEQAYDQLEEMVQQLESGDLSLDRAMTLFEQGMKLAERCNSQLDEAELKVTRLATASGAGPETDFDLSPFEDDLPLDETE